MLIQIFRPITSDVQTLQGNKLADITTASSYTYTRRFIDVGDFTLTVPIHSKFSEHLKTDNWLWVDYSDWLIIQNVEKVLSTEGFELHVQGVDMKGLLLQRITLYGEPQDTGTTGYDVVQGSTETCVKHYIKNNITAPLDLARRIPGFVIAPDQRRGIANDTYMSRFETLADVSKKLCQNADIGYDVAVDVSTSKIVFDVAVPRDLTQNQSENNRVVFAVERGNVSQLSQTLGNHNYKNAFYTTVSGGALTADAVTQLVYREGDDQPAGIYRREMQLNVSITEEVAGQELQDMINLARKAAVDYEMADNVNVQIKGEYRLGIDYNLGDYATVKDDLLGEFDKQITETTISYGADGPPTSLTFGEREKKILNILNTKIQNKGV